MAEYYPPVGFHFKVEFVGLPTPSGGVIDADAYFMEVSGLSREFVTQPLRQGGDNENSFVMPTQTRHPNLILKRGLLVNSNILRWVNNAMENMDIKPCNIVVKLLNEAHDPLMTFQCEHAIPLKWSIDSFNAQESKIVVETLEIYYKKFRIIFPEGAGVIGGGAGSGTSTQLTTATTPGTGTGTTTNSTTTTATTTNNTGTTTTTGTTPQAPGTVGA